MCTEFDCGSHVWGGVENGAVHWRAGEFEIISFGESVIVEFVGNHSFRAFDAPPEQFMWDVGGISGDISLSMSVANLNQRKMEVEKQKAVVKPSPLLLQAASKVLISSFISPSFSRISDWARAFPRESFRHSLWSYLLQHIPWFSWTIADVFPCQLIIGRRWALFVTISECRCSGGPGSRTFAGVAK